MPTEQQRSLVRERTQDIIVRMMRDFDTGYGPPGDCPFADIALEETPTTLILHFRNAWFFHALLDQGDLDVLALKISSKENCGKEFEVYVYDDPVVVH